MWKRWSFKQWRESVTAVESGLASLQLTEPTDETTSATQPRPSIVTHDTAGVENETAGTAGAGNVMYAVLADSAISESSVPVPVVTASPAPIQQSSNVVTAKSAAGINCPSERVEPPSILGAQQMNTVRQRISFRSLAFFYGRDKQTIPISPSSISVNSDHTKREKIPKKKLSRPERESRSAAIAVRTLIMGPSSLPLTPRSTNNNVLTKATNVPPPPDIKKVKEQLLKPKSANDIVRHLRQLPLPDGPSFHPSGHTSNESLVTHPNKGGTPIHAVCLPCTDEEAEKLHFSRLRNSHSLVNSALLSPTAPSASSAPSEDQANISTASLESLVSVLQDLQPVSLLDSPDLGFGQPVSESNSGPLAGSVPSPMTIMEGFEDITKQLMALGFATSKAIYPSHKSIHPPEDRLSVLTYWWGLELVLPEPSVKYLGKVKSISGTLLNLLSVLSMFNNGAREILPFVRYIANFVDFEWSAIQSQDKGKGVVCAATWIMPAAMVPRPWDFDPLPTASTANQNTANDGVKSPPSKENFSFLPNPHALESVSPSLPMMPQLIVTPATLPRNFETPNSPTPS